MIHLFGLIPCIWLTMMLLGIENNPCYTLYDAMKEYTHSTGDCSKSSLLHKPTPENKDKGYLYPVDNEVVDDLRRITREYAKKIGGLPIISILPRREY